MLMKSVAPSVNKQPCELMTPTERHGSGCDCPPLSQALLWTGRPVDILEMPDGALLISDDFASAVYRLSYNKTLAASA